MYDVLTVLQSQLLKLLGEKLATFRVKLLARWDSKTGGVTQLAESRSENKHSSLAKPRQRRCKTSFGTCISVVRSEMNAKKIKVLLTVLTREPSVAYVDQIGSSVA